MSTLSTLCWLSSLLRDSGTLALVPGLLINAPCNDDDDDDDDDDLDSSVVVI